MKITNTSIAELSNAQIAMLNMSDEDIKHGRVVSHGELDKMDREWLRTLI